MSKFVQLNIAIAIAAALITMAVVGAQPLPEDFEEDKVRIQEILCEGNQDTSCDFIRDVSGLKPGDQVQSAHIDAAKIKIASSGKFNTVATKLEKGQKRGQVVLKILVEENNSLFLNAEVSGLLVKNSYSSKHDSALFTEAIGGTTNLFGIGKALTLSGRNMIFFDEGKDARWTGLSLDFLDPSVLSSNRFFYRLGLDYDTFTGSSGYRQSWMSPNLTFGTRLFDHSYFAISYLYRFEPGPEDDYKFYDQTVQGQYGWSTEDDQVFPTSGSQFNLIYSKSFNRYTLNGSESESFASTFATIAYNAHLQLDQAHMLTFNVGSPQNFNDSPFKTKVSSDQIPLSVRYSYDVFRNRKSKSLSDLRLYFESGVGGTLGYGSNKGFRLADGAWASKLGSIMEFRDFGNVGLSFTYVR